jgi:hypothetical protein
MQILQHFNRKSTPSVLKIISSPHRPMFYKVYTEYNSTIYTSITKLILLLKQQFISLKYLLHY